MAVRGGINVCHIIYISILFLHLKFCRIRNICWITYISIIILQSLFLGIEVQYLEKRDIHLCGGHSPPPIFSLSQLKYKSSQLLVGYSLLLSVWQKFVHIPCSDWIILTFIPYQLTPYTVHTARSIALIGQTFITLPNQ